MTSLAKAGNCEFKKQNGCRLPYAPGQWVPSRNFVNWRHVDTRRKQYLKQPIPGDMFRQTARLATIGRVKTHANAAHKRLQIERPVIWPQVWFAGKLRVLKSNPHNSDAMNSSTAKSVLVALAMIVPTIAEDKADFYYGKGMMNELPHERGELIDGFTGVDFPVTTKDQTARRFFLQGLAYIYMGNDTEAARSFREVITRDPDCAMGYWGIAMAFETDFSRRVEYMWYAAERKDKVKTDVERDLIDAYNDFFGTTKQPEMVLVDSETGKRRARPTLGNIERRRDKLASAITELTKKYPTHPELIPLTFLDRPRWETASTYMSDPPQHPLPFRLTPWHKDARFRWVDGLRQRDLAGAWNGLGMSFKHVSKADAALAFEAACRLDNAWLKKWDAMPYERHGYFTHRHNLRKMTGDLPQGKQLPEPKNIPRHPQGAFQPHRLYQVADSSADGKLTATDSQRQIIEKLGPLRLKPPIAPDFLLPAAKTGQMTSLKDLKGPTIVVFYLGFGCIHCVEQLNELRPRYKDFKDAGIEIVAIGTDDVNEVKAAILDAIEVDGPPTPFEILSDPKHDAFKAFHCWDEFTDEALHGTFLIDTKGRVRWRDISEQPFMETNFLLKESKRLLSQ